MKRICSLPGVFSLLALLVACGGPENAGETAMSEEPPQAASPTAQVRPEIYAEFSLVADLSGLNDGQRRMLLPLTEANIPVDIVFNQGPSELGLSP